MKEKDRWLKLLNSGLNERHKKQPSEIKIIKTEYYEQLYVNITRQPRWKEDS